MPCPYINCVLRIDDLMTEKTGMTDLPADQDARDRALSPKASFHLEAPAGSGKTSVLLARLLTLLAKCYGPGGTPGPDLYPQGRGRAAHPGDGVPLAQR